MYNILHVRVLSTKIKNVLDPTMFLILYMYIGIMNFHRRPHKIATPDLINKIFKNYFFIC